MSTKSTVQRPRSLASEQAILKATLSILIEGGYAALTIDRVAATAKASKATIYRRWKTKEHLILAVITQMPLPQPADCGSLKTDLIDQFGQYARIMQHSPFKSVMPMLAAECVSNPTLSSALTLVNDQRRVPLRTILKRAIRRGEIDALTDLELAIDVIQGAVTVRIYFLLESLTEEWVSKLIHLVTVGIGAPQKRAKTPSVR